MPECPSRIEELACRALARLRSESKGEAARMEAAWDPGRPGSPAGWEEREEGRPVVEGDRLRAAGARARLRLRGAIPASWKGRRVAAEIDAGGWRGIAWRGQEVFGAIGEGEPPLFFPEPARGGERVELEAAFSDPGETPAARLFGGARLVAWEPEPAAAALDLEIALGVYRASPEGSARRARAGLAIAEALEGERGTAASIRAGLRELLAKKNGDTLHRIALALAFPPLPGDPEGGRTAWADAVSRAAASVLAALERNPGLVAAGPDPLFYAAVRRADPALYQAVRRAVRKGQWEVVGGFWATPLSWAIGGESSVRQLLIGRRFLSAEFGAEPETLLLPELQGAFPALPQLLRGAGFKQLVACDGIGPTGADAFDWEGPDGARIAVHRPPGGVLPELTAERLAESARRFAERDRAGRSLALVAAGGCGAGDRPAALLAALRDVEGLPSARPERLADFFPKAARETRATPLWVGGIPRRTPPAWCARRGAANRRGETLLATAEFLDALAFALGAGSGGDLAPVARGAERDLGLPAREPSPADHLDRAWRLLLANQSAAGTDTREAAADFVLVHELGTAVVRHGLERLAAWADGSGRKQPVLLVNPLGHARAETVAMPGGGMLFVRVPPCGLAVADASEARPVETDAQPVRADFAKRRAVLENGFLRAEFEPDGRLASLRDLRIDREVLPPGAHGQIFESDGQPLPPGPATMEFLEKSPSRAVLKIEWKPGGSKIAVRAVMRAGSARLDFETAIEWNRGGSGLSVRFPVDVRAERATYQTPFGSVELPTHRNGGCGPEPQGNGWVDCSESGFGVALMSDAGCRVTAGRGFLRVDLAGEARGREPGQPLGGHRATYAILPHAGDHREGRVEEQALELMFPLQAVGLAPEPGQGKTAASLFSFDRPGLCADAVKRSEDGKAVVLRFHEAFGGRGRWLLSAGFDFREVHLATPLERPLRKLDHAGPEVPVEAGPHEIVTLRFAVG